MERHHLSHNDLLRAIGMLEAGQSQRDVSRALGVSPSVIYWL